MLNIFKSNPLIEDAQKTIPFRKPLKTTLIFFLLFLISSLYSGIIQSVPLYIYMFSEGFKQGLNGSEAFDSAQIIEDLTVNPPSWLTAFSLFATIGTIIVVLFYCFKMERRSGFSMGFTKKGIFKQYIGGLFIGAVMFGAVYLIMILCGDAEFLGFNNEASYWMIAIFFLGFIIQGASEEILVRSYYLVDMACSSNVNAAIFASSMVFSLLHIFNNGISVLAIINLFLFGVFAAVYFLKTKNIWGICALHTIWNFAQGNVFGCRVSGMVLDDSIINTEITSDTLINGGAFGPEGGFAVTAVLVIGIVILAFIRRKENANVN